MPDSLLEKLARQRGLGEAYHDYRGELKAISLATKTAILAAMGCQVGDTGALERELAELDDERWRSLLPPVAVISPGRTGAAIAVAAQLLDGALEWRLALERGGEVLGSVRTADLTELERREGDGRWPTRRLLVMPEHLPEGYHSLTVRTPDGAQAQCALIVAPGRCYEPAPMAEGGRLWGIAVQLYTLRSTSNWGIGDFADLETVVRRCAAQGAAFVGLNPLHALFTSNPAHCSPYSPSSRHFLNIFYIAVGDVPEFAECAPASRRVAEAGFGAELERLRATAAVDYPGVAAAKLPVLRDLYEHFRHEHVAKGTARAAAFHAYVSERGEPLRLHSIHDAIDEHLRSRDRGRYWGWPVWPAELCHPAHRGVSEFALAHGGSVEFHAWLQWLADEQLGRVQRLARELGMPIGLYGDYAVGVNPNGSETWSDPAVYRTGASVGAPPDALALKGQDWGLLPQDPHALTAERYRPFRDLVAANMRHFGALRLDHVMAMFRQWWVPVGFGATEGGYVHYPVADLMSVLALESRRHACLVVGEDLGTVPPEMSHAMAERAVYSYKVLLFEKHGDGRFRGPAEYLRRAIATVTTHDLPTLRGYWEGSDIELRSRLGLYPSEELHRHVQEERVRDRAALLAALDAAGLRPAHADGSATQYTSELAHAVQLYLARSAAALVILQIEDLAGMAEPVNVPGTNEEHANWQRKVTGSVDDIFARDDVARLLRDVRHARSS
jgi:4-alpha-glucanotransferase